MANYQIITNNPAVLRAYAAVAHEAPGPVSSVFTAVRNLVHTGARLISHPLAGSVKPNESPYKSVVLSSQKGPVEFRSLQLIEDATATLQKLPPKPKILSEATRADYMLIDLDLMRSAMASLPPDYY